jgi:hypothetical protein
LADVGDISQAGPTGTITVEFGDGLTFEGTYDRATPDALGVLDLIEIELFDHLTDHAGEVARWTYSGKAPATGVRSDSFSISFPNPLPGHGLILDLPLGTYCWRVRLRDSLGVWTSWFHTSGSIFTLSAAAPELSAQWPEDATPTLEVPAGLRFSALYSDDGDNPPLSITAQVIAQAGSEAWGDGDFSPSALLWSVTAPPRYFQEDDTRVAGRIFTRYSGRTLPDGGTYLWRMKAANIAGVESGWVGGQFSIEARDTAIPGPVETLTDQFSQVWETSVIPKPVGLWYDPDDSANVKVVDRQTKNMYTLRQSDRTIVGTTYIGGICAYPLGLSGDPADDTVYWLLRAPWAFGGALSGNQLLKVRRADNVVLSTFNIANGRWTAIKVSSNWLYATNWDDDKIYQFNKSTGAVNNSWGITYESVVQKDPTGIMVDGTTLYYFFHNSGTTKRFLVADESAPTTITGAKSTEGLAILGGEMDTTTHYEMFGDSDSLGKVWKFTLTVATYENGGQVGRLRPAITTYADA